MSAATGTAKRTGPGRPSSGARERIHEAAVAVLRADGYAGLTVGKVAERAGESKALIAYHYGSKLGLVASAGRAVAEEVTARLVEAIEDGNSAEGIVRAVLSEVEAIADDDPGLARIYFDLASVAVVDPGIRETINEINAQLKAMVCEQLAGAADGPSPERARAMTTLLLAAGQGLALERIELGPSEELDAARELLIEGLVAEG